MKDKFMTVLTASTIRELVRKVNDLNIKKDDIVSLLREKEQLMLIYYSKLD